MLYFKGFKGVLGSFLVLRFLKKIFVFFRWFCISYHWVTCIVGCIRLGVFFWFQVFFSVFLFF